MSAVPHPPSPALSCDALMGDVVRLEPLAPEHVPGLRRAAEGAGPSAFAAVPAPQEVEAYVARALERRDAGAYAPFAQVEVATGRVVGHTAYLTPRWMDGGRLFAVEIGSSWLHPAARGAIAATGATFEAVLRAWQPSLAPGEEGRVRDTAMFSVTPPEWPRVRARLEERIARRRASRRG